MNAWCVRVRALVRSLYDRGNITQQEADDLCDMATITILAIEGGPNELARADYFEEILTIASFRAEGVAFVAPWSET